MSSLSAKLQAPRFELNDKQVDQLHLLSTASTHVLAYGGSRGGKTFGFVRAIVLRALAAPGSRHLICRFRFNAVWRTVRLDTFVKVMRLCFPGVKYKAHDQLGYVTLPGGSEIWFAGLDKPERIDKILGAEYASILVNEASEVEYDVIATLRSRLAQKVLIKGGPHAGRALRLKMFYDLNPTTRKHWSYREFIEKVAPDTGLPLKRPGDFTAMIIPPSANTANLADGYLDALENLPRLQRLRFFEGKYISDVDGALWRQATFKRVSRANLPAMVRIVIGVDPSGAEHTGEVANDEIGIVVVGLGVDGLAYVLEDLSLRTGPNMWAGMVARAYRRLGADCVRYENNYGGAMGVALMRTVDPHINVKSRGTGSRGKVARAEPIAALYEQGKVRHVGAAEDFEDLEDQLMQFTVAGYMGPGSPDRGDALVWALTELMLGNKGPANATAVSANG
jgi:hypothetical protein